MAHKEFEHWSEAKQIEAVTTFLVLGNMSLVAAATGVPVGTLRRWKAQSWWTEMVSQIQTESDQQLDSKLAKRVDKALDLVMDRLEQGDFIYNPKTGEFVRKPVSLRDTWKMTNEMLDKRMLLRKQPKEQANQEAVGAILKNLATEFAAMARKKVKEDGTEPSEAELQTGVQELSGEAGAD